jgi:ectoine hydroxylase-related dioxygenase (phytanoyl-CoA dioxygenase family)
MESHIDAHRVDTDWAKLTLGERIQHLEVEGYLVIPDLLSPDYIEKLKAETRNVETRAADYSDKKQAALEEMTFAGGEISKLIANPPLIAFLKELCGDELIMMSYTYVRTDPGFPGISLHCDGQPWSSKIFGYKFSCPRLVRVLYYLDDLTPEISPFRVLPRSHLSFHNEGNPYLRYEEHPEQVMVTCKAGSAVLINQNIFHGNFPNVGDRSREMLAIAYRPSWAGPAGEVESRDLEKVAELPPDVQLLLGDPNTRIWMHDNPNKPDKMAREAPGINTSRWDQ